MADEKSQAKPFESGILNKTTGRPGDTIQRSYNTEVVKERPQKPSSVYPSQPEVKKKG